MMISRKIEILVGSFLLLGIAAILMLMLQVADSKLGANNESYRLYAKFDNVGGLKIRSAIKVGGVVVGRVAGISLDNEDFTPLVAMDISSEFNQFPGTSSVAILTSGLLGEQFIGLTPGFIDEEENTVLVENDHIEDTRSAMVLEDLIGQFLYGNSDE
jgi:phospholipid/cholesterol/gamma-HCH transport system substrate-binding protein